MTIAEKYYKLVMGRLNEDALRAAKLEERAQCIQRCHDLIHETHFGKFPDSFHAANAALQEQIVANLKLEAEIMGVLGTKIYYLGDGNYLYVGVENDGTRSLEITQLLEDF